MSNPDLPPPDAATTRPKYRVPIGMPLRGEHRREGAVISVLLHVALIALLLVPIVFSRTVITRIEQGAGGAGPAGGGGGGRMGEGQGTHETLRFVRIAPDPPAQAQPKPTPPTPPVPPPVVPKIPPPQVTPPAQQAPEQPAAPAPVQSVATAPGAGAGTGKDGTNGNGPGSGGGVGSGTGPGRGSGTGPGTGGGTQANYPPQPIEFFLPPIPAPSSVKGFRFTAEFDVDSTGKVLDIHFTETRDGDYNRRLYSVLRSMKFKPGTRPDGTPVRMKAQVGYEF